MILDDLSLATTRVREWLGDSRPELAMVVGSGLASVLDQCSISNSLAYANIPNFSRPAVSGHAGVLHLGTFADREVLIFQGRFHLYEGYSAWQVTAPVRLAAAVGCRKLLLTNASGGIDPQLCPGDFLLVADHLNLTGINPLTGRPEQQFLDLTQLYQTDFFLPLQQQLSTIEVELRQGILAWMPGPSYETAAEIQALQRLGAAAVSMSTIPEAIIACRYGLETVAIASISNFAAGISPIRLDHQDVLARGIQAGPALGRLLHLLFNLW